MGRDGQGRVYVNMLAGGTIHFIALPGGSDAVIVWGLGTPQGIAPDGRGLIVVDSGHGRILGVTLVGAG